ncbi:2Fe-2S iron-sulfur cluster-binding protein [Actinopolymorpha sp. B17G11]|uniref:2Fe-2S iron-sulfur cluster-binding protein n=1 Tax=Actinopolymorpha sp. B17G11 TaxID=3160861 RepID=UPI0032E5260A
MSGPELTGHRHAVFHALRVADVRRETDDAVVVTFEVPAELADAYRFLPGQHVTVRTPEAGDDLRRNYSICTEGDPAGPDGPRWLRIGVKRVAHGGFSAYALERMRAGDLVDVMTPTGRFCVTPDPLVGRHLCFVAAGSGITPVLSMCASVLAFEPKSQITLLYGNRTSASIMFVEDLADLKDRYADRFHLVHVLSREQPEVSLFGGRIDGAKVRTFLDTLVDAESVQGWYLCGPYAMVDELRRVLRAHGVARERVHSELFHVGPATNSTAKNSTAPAETVSPAGKVLPAEAVLPVEAGSAVAAGASGSAAACEVTAIMDGRRSTFLLDRAGPPVLEGVLGVRSDAPFACRGGVCGTCRAKVREGTVTMDLCYALEPDEVERGYVLTCQSHPTSYRLVVDYDA